MDASRRKWFVGAGGLIAGGVAWSLGRHARAAAAEACAPGRSSGPMAPIPEETAGPFPLHALLDDPAIVRSAIADGREGVPLEFELRLLDAADGRPMNDAGVYVWHCDRDGAYSGYGDQRAARFCRGLQFADCDGRVRFRSIFPGWYPGRATHVHFEVYATSGGRLLATSQFAFPDEITHAVQASGLYPDRTPMPNTRDGAFRDDLALHLARTEGTPRDGLRAALDIGIRRA